MEILYDIIEYLFPYYDILKKERDCLKDEIKRLDGLYRAYKRDYINTKQAYNELCEKYEFVVREVQNISLLDNIDDADE